MFYGGNTMTRDEAIKIAAHASPAGLSKPSREWASIVVERADALLAAMGDPVASPLTSLFANQLALNEEINRRARGMADVNAKPTPRPMGCCAATEARVVREIAEWCCRYGGAANWIARPIKRGDWKGTK